MEPQVNPANTKTQEVVIQTSHLELEDQLYQANIENQELRKTKNKLKQEFNKLLLQVASLKY